MIKERIRDEILAGELAERRMLEDEVRREIEMERVMNMRRIQMERTRFSRLAGTSDTFNRGNTMPQSFFPSRPQIKSGPSRYFEDAAEHTFRERSPFRPSQYQNSEFLPSQQNANFRLSGTKRKIKGESQLPEKQWGCALCEVHTTCENSLKAHLEGKKHKTKEALVAPKNISRDEPSENSHPLPKKNGTLRLKGTLASGTSAIGSKNKQPPVKGGSALQTKGTSASGLKNKKLTSGGGHWKRFWCSVCRVKCNSENMLELHRAGRKHKFLTELKESNNFANKNPADNGAPVVVKEAAVPEGELGAEVLSADGN